MNSKIVISILINAALFASVLGYNKPATYSNSDTKTVTLFNDRDFEGFSVEYTFDGECLDLDKVNAEPSPASSARLIRGGCVTLSNVPCDDKFRGVRGQCTELSERNQMTETKFLSGLNDRVRSIRSCSDEFEISELTRNERGTERREEVEHSNRYNERRGARGFREFQLHRSPRLNRRNSHRSIGLKTFLVGNLIANANV